MEKIRIAFVIDTIDDQIGGTERQLLLLLKYLDRDRFEPYLCCLKGSAMLDRGFGLCPVHVMGFGSFFSPAAYAKLYAFSRFLRAKKIDVVQTHLRDGNIAGSIAAWLAGIKTLVSTRRNQGYWYNKKELAILKALRRITPYYMVNSGCIKTFMHEVEGIPSEIIEVIYNGFELSSFSGKTEGEKEKCRRGLGLGPEDEAITIVANLRPVKCIDVLIRAAAAVSPEHPAARFLIVGEGPEREALSRLAKDLGVFEKILFLGKRDDISDILAVSKIGVLSSRSEGLSNAIIEYMAMGLPVVCTEVGGNPEMVEDGVNGFLVPSGGHSAMAEAINKLLDDKALCAAMGERSLKKAHEMFSLENLVKRTESYYLKIAGRT